MGDPSRSLFLDVQSRYLYSGAACVNILTTVYIVVDAMHFALLIGLWSSSGVVVVIITLFLRELFRGSLVMSVPT